MARYAQADEDTWLHLRGVSALLVQAMHACEHELRLPVLRLYWGVMETFSWELERREPVQWNYAFRAKGSSGACEGGALWRQSRASDGQASGSQRKLDADRAHNASSRSSVLPLAAPDADAHPGSGAAGATIGPFQYGAGARICVTLMMADRLC